MGNERRSRETCTMSVLERPRYQNAETHEYHSIWRNRTLPKSSIFSVFYIVMYQNTKMHLKHFISGKETCDVSIYKRVRHENAENHGKLPL